MDRCDQCGNAYDKCLVVERDGVRRVFDSFECAIAAMAPLCAACGCRVIGHGVEEEGVIFCCVHCAAKHGPTSLRDRA
ncbi:hypothetical protein [Sphingopyxis terrae]|uniref:Metallothionein n=1 Tax=Sphingopyxis terrae subsp. ummariensis TaxID=429001 RepID=A0A1Y6FVA5_9SPHN|nr:hypothetical protein CPA46_07590 [Sphingopyxis terrae subsp. ummariensis]SMQ76483.1 hypothetical protein SAMN06295984_1925 [Sphingopyxis terrae subsp. ummariensis]